MKFRWPPGATPIDPNEVEGLLPSHMGNWKQPPLTWGRLGLTAPGAARRAYLDALRAADAHDFQPLLAFARS